MNCKKLLSVIILDILNKETDVDHAMSTAELLVALGARGYECDRKTLSDNIDALNEAGFEIMCTRGRSNMYYVADRVFDDPEIRILLDAVQASSFITDKKSEVLCAKIAELAGKRGAEILRQNTVAFNITKTTNESVYYSVSMISDAIKERKKIAFEYFDYDCAHKRVYRGDGKKYIVNPYATVFSDDKYYMICYHDNHDNMTHYRVDRMSGVEITDEPVTVKPELDGFDVSKHKKQIFGMFSGETVRSEFSAVNEKFVIDGIFDKFGGGTAIKDNGDTVSFSADVQESTPFFAWVCSFGGKLKITAPSALVNRFGEYISELYSQYCEK